MPTLSVYQAQRPLRHYAEADCFAACGNKQDIALLKLSIRTGHPVLIGLDGENTIVKPAGEGDEATSFEALYDTCHTVRDLDRMKAAGVDDPTLVPLETYRLDVRTDIVLPIGFPMAITARNSGDCRARLRELLEKDPMFREAISQRILEIISLWLRHDPDSPDLYVREATAHGYEPLDPPLTPEGPQWRLLDDDEE